jgi:Lrp/AsnC family transcriptional regulator for asnA, asnC and gidA
MSEKLDIKDRRILYEIERNSRQTDSDISRIIGTSKQVVRYRIANLIKRGIIKTFQTSINLSKLGLNVYGNIYFKLQNITPEREQEIIHYLIGLPEVVYLASIGGQYEISIVLFARTLPEFMKKLNQITSKYPDNLNNRTIALRIATQKFNKEYLLEGKEKKIKTEKKFILLEEDAYQQQQELENIDLEILKLLTKNSRTSLVEMSKITKKPVSTLHFHLKKLITSKVISGFPALLDLKKINIQNYKMFIFLTDQSEKIEKKLYQFCENHPNITWFFKTLAEWTHEIRIEVENQEKYQNIVKQIRYNLGNSIGKIETISIFNEYKEDYSAAFAE